MPADPDQADQGALVYYYNCMVCHGDRGQGLTDEFRSLWSPGDRNCWQAKCHGANHPPDGFEIVRYVPPVVGEGTLARSLNAQQLHSYLRTTMPWQTPGRLSDEEYWQLTAFLLRENGVLESDEPLGPEGATAAPENTPGGSAAGAPASTTIPHPAAGETARSAVGPAALIGLGVVVGLAVAWAIVKASRQREE